MTRPPFLDALDERARAGLHDRATARSWPAAELGDTYGEPVADGLRVELVSQDELASLCGASREAVARALRTLRAADVVHTGRRTVTISDVDRLRRWPDR